MYYIYIYIYTSPLGNKKHGNKKWSISIAAERYFLKIRNRDTGTWEAGKKTETKQTRGYGGGGVCTQKQNPSRNGSRIEMVARESGHPARNWLNFLFGSLIP